ncbi:MAG TPA: adenylate/guanylate cyclase domain-containing protein, partial [Sinorhizobium sp.]|nr:adenylate/guanylate cyclase domain-containing protein [Sinorhizobium sp.]
MQSFSEVQPNSPDEGDGIWPTRRRKVLDWLVNETRGERFIDNIFVDMCEGLAQAGVPLARATLHFRIHHPQWIGARILWRKGLSEAEIDTFDYGTEDTSQYLNSPLFEINNGGAEVRRRLDAATADGPHYPLFDELRDAGLTDYIAWPLEHSLGKRHVVTFASDRPGGFAAEDIALFADLLPAL